jgi:hypothetical protein
VATEAWIDSASRTPRRPVGGGIGQDSVHVLHLPVGERAAALKERERARCTVRRVADEDAEELLEMLGLIKETP